LKAEIGIIGGSGSTGCPDLHRRRRPPSRRPSGGLRTITSWAHWRAGGCVPGAARAGPSHLSLELNFRANIYGMKSLGVERIVSLSAVGSLKEQHRPLDFVVPDQFFDRTRGRISTFFGEGLVAHIGFADPVCPS